MKNKLTYTELERLLPDYLFGSLDNETKLQFEESAKDYPEILSEIESIKNTFNQFEKFDLKSSIKQESKNLSVKVQERLIKQKKSHLIMGILPKYVYPSLGLVALIYFVFISDPLTNTTPIVNNEIVIFSDSDTSLVNLELDDVLPELIESNLSYNDPLSLSNLIDETNIYNINPDNLNHKYFLYNTNYEQLINNLNEDEFLELLEELNNENIDV